MNAGAVDALMARFDAAREKFSTYGGAPFDEWSEFVQAADALRTALLSRPEGTATALTQGCAKRLCAALSYFDDDEPSARIGDDLDYDLTVADLRAIGAALLGNVDVFLSAQPSPLSTTPPEDDAARVMEDARQMLWRCLAWQRDYEAMANGPQGAPVMTMYAMGAAQMASHWEMAHDVIYRLREVLKPLLRGDAVEHPVAVAKPSALTKDSEAAR